MDVSMLVYEPRDIEIFLIFALLLSALLGVSHLLINIDNEVRAYNLQPKDR